MSIFYRKCKALYLISLGRILFAITIGRRFHKMENFDIYDGKKINITTTHPA